MNYKLYSLFFRTIHGKYEETDEAASYRIERKGSTLYFFFEKSSGALDWKNNLDFPAKPYKKMGELWFCHRGFLRVFSAVEEKILPEIVREDVKKIIISGYSHGAALALLCHEFCVFHRPDLKDKIFGFGFGCPRVVWGMLKKSVKKRFENFTVVRCKNDLVTHLPPALFLFRHVGKTVQIGKDLKVGMIDAHRQESYLRALQSEKGGTEWTY